MGKKEVEKASNFVENQRKESHLRKIVKESLIGQGEGMFGKKDQTEKK